MALRHQLIRPNMSGETEIQMPLSLTADASTIQEVDPAKLTFNEAVFQKMPDLPADDFEKLTADIAAFGVKVPIEVTTKGVVLDGHNRVKCAREAGLDLIPAIVKDFDSDEDAVAHIFAVNLQRRHMNRTDKAKLVKEYLLLDPYKSNRQVAEELGVVSDKTVGAVRDEAEAAGEIEKSTTRKGKDGKTRSSTSTRKPKGGTSTAERKLAEQRKNTVQHVASGLAQVAALMAKDPEFTAEVMVGTLTPARKAKVAENLTVAINLYTSLAAELGLEGWEYQQGEGTEATEEDAAF